MPLVHSLSKYDNFLAYWNAYCLEYNGIRHKASAMLLVHGLNVILVEI